MCAVTLYECESWIFTLREKHKEMVLTSVPCIFIICSSTNKYTKVIYYINILLHSCTYVMLRHVSTSVLHHQGTHLFLAKITCVASVVIDYKTGKIHKIVRQIKYINYMNVIYTFLKTLVCKMVFDVAVYTICKI